ncbi:MAG: cobalt transporter CbiM, partial [Chloroflexi bacterium]|nr:cobalt transporter CbiM [Chloroflexota bacterium]
MHIPDGYLSPITAGTMYVVSTPFWIVAVQRVRKALTRRTVPALALFSAFAFIVMMFNIPLPGGTTGHAVGGTLLAIVLGPWTAVIGVSVVLAIQALLFGDGGLIAFGANCFNMAIVLPWVGYFIYKVISGNSDIASKRRLVGAVVGSYIAIIVAALVTGIELGIQPSLFHTADGTPLYAPYGLEVALPTMAIGHLAIAGPVEAIVTGLVFFYLQKSQSSLLAKTEEPRKEGKLWIVWSAALVVLAFATPLGLLAAGTAWGEWGAGELKNVLGYVPKGLESMADFWKAPIPDYSVPGVGKVPGYI